MDRLPAEIETEIEIEKWTAPRCREIPARKTEELCVRQQSGCRVSFLHL